MNLVSNAAEAIPNNGTVTISTANRYLEVPLKGYDDIDVGEYVVLTVLDNGPGVSPEDLDRIFEPFYTKKVMGKSGTGLGLAVVWNVIQDHNGFIDVKTSRDGTRFELFFPITRDKVNLDDAAISFDDLQGYGEIILVIDDEENQRDISCRILKSIGYEAKAVPSGEEAVEYLKKNTVDLIVLDMIMDPGMNGRATYEKIIEVHPQQKALIVSGYAETDDVKEIQKLGAGAFIQKPLTFEKFGMAVREELKR
jgi:CheY-like chemotaxis protein